MEFRQLEAFVATAELRSFSKAARYLYLSQSTVSSHINNLENKLGKQLLLRTTKNISLTPAGETFLLYARKMVETKNLAILSLQQASKTILNIGASSIPSAYLLPDIIAGFCQKHPETQFNIQQSGSDDILQLLLNGNIDLAFTGKDMHSSFCEGFIISTDKLILITPYNDKYLSLKESHTGIGDILKCPMILRANGSGTQFFANKVLESLGIEKSKLNIVAQSNDLESIKQMVIKGIGISICSEFAVKDLLAANQVIAYPLKDIGTRCFSLYYSSFKKNQPHIKKFIDYMQKIAKEHS